MDEPVIYPPPTVVWALMSPATYDSCAGVVSLHRSEEGAYLERCRLEDLPRTGMGGVPKDYLEIEQMEVFD